MTPESQRAFRWRDMLESGEYTTIREIGAAEKINQSYVHRILRLTFLEPDIVEAILDGRQPPGGTASRADEAIPMMWNEQQANSGS